MKMIKLLIKKQLAELFSSMFQRSSLGKNAKYKKSSGKGMIILYAALLIYVFAVFSFMFFGTSKMLFEAFIPMGLDWLAFALMGIAATGFGIFGTVFLANSVLYNAKDNEFLLSMPIKPRDIILARIFTIYVMDFFYEAMILIPCAAAYLVLYKFSVSALIGCIFAVFALPLFSLALSCILGFLIALLSAKIKNKSLFTVIFSFGFLAVYFYLIMEMENYLAILISSGEIIAENIKTFAYPVYSLGMACTGDLLSLLIFLVCVTAFFALIMFIVCSSFIKLSTAKHGGKKAVYKEKTYRENSAQAALVIKELAHFRSSPAYVLNGAFGSVLMIAGIFLIIIKGADIAGMLAMFPIDGLLPLALFAMIFTIASMNLITAPSISLEGRTLWLLRSLPVTAKSILMSKVWLHMIISGIPALLFSLTASVFLPMDMAARTLLPVCAIVSNLLFAVIGLIFNLKHHSFDWTNETVPVKQGISVLLTMLTGMGMTMFFVIVYVILSIGIGIAIPASAYMLGINLICTVMCALLYKWLVTRGVKIFETMEN